MTYKIEKGIAIPRRHGRRYSETTLTAIQMKRGHSVLCDSLGSALRLRAAITSRKGKAVQRKVDGGIRVWKVA